MQAAFYDEKKTYEENYTFGPPISHLAIKPPKRKTLKIKHSFLGFSINSPFGIPAGPLLNSKYIKSAFEWGYDVSTYKTIRSNEYPCHPFPNVLFVDTQNELHPDSTPRLIATSTPPRATTRLSITNSFGVPSRPSAIWQKDVKKALSYEKDGQLMIVSFMGTVKEGQTQDEFIKDYTTAAKLARVTGPKALEVNLSCPNIGNEGLVCYNIEVTEAVCQSIRKAIGKTPLILKIGYYKDSKQLEKIAEIASKYAQAIAAINTLQVEVVDKKGNQALPGKMRLKSGVCGSGIKWAGLEMTEKLQKIRKNKHYSYEIIGVGGVMKPQDFTEYRKLGADIVQSATGAMWNPYLAQEIQSLMTND